MSTITKRPRYFLDIEPELRNRFKALAALHGKTMKDWLIEAIIAKMEDEIDAAEGLAALGKIEGTLSLDEYLKSRSGKRSES